MVNNINNKPWTPDIAFLEILEDSRRADGYGSTTSMANYLMHLLTEHIKDFPEFRIVETKDDGQEPKYELRIEKEEFLTALGYAAKGVYSVNSNEFNEHDAEIVRGVKRIVGKAIGHMPLPGSF